MKKCLVVLGMHRSGTSAFTGILDLLGVNLGTRMLETQADNAKGFFENKYVVLANDCILETLQTSWDDPLPLPAQWQDRFEDTQLPQDIRAFLHDEISAEGLSALKDPRLCKLLPLWLPLFAAEKVSPCFALVVRNPLEIAQSLQSRNGFSTAKSLILWMQHMREAERLTRHLPRAIVKFEALLDDPQQTISRAFRSIGLELPQLAQESSEELNRFLDQNMRHHHISDAQLDSDCIRPVAEFYRLLCTISAQDTPDAGQLRRLDELGDEFAASQEFFYNPDLLDERQQAIQKTQPEWFASELQHVKDQFDADKIHREYRYIANTEFLMSHTQSLERERKELRTIADRLEHEIQQFLGSPPWRVYKKYQETVEKFIPEGSGLRRLLQSSKRSLGALVGERTTADVENANEQAGASTAAADIGAATAVENNGADTNAWAPLEFTYPESPRASIIIPVFNNWQFTYKCLQSVHTHTSGNFELIVVDNHSTDVTPQLLAAMQGIEVITNPTNEVFVNACNQAAERARGEYLLLLNNDTEVTAGWLEALLAPFDDATTGVVGAKLIYPDGRLQEAGGIIWRDGSGCNYGHGDDPDLPQYCYRRAVDYCSGACLAIPRKLWQEIGGFDQRYAPAYYEDTDLCFTVRALHYKVIYQPEARVIHYGGASAGKETSSGYKRFQDINKEKFVEKWRDQLDREHVMSSAGLLNARERMGDKRILIIDHYVPTFDRDSGSLRMLSMLQILQHMGYKVLFWPDDLTYDPRYSKKLQDLGIETYYGNVGFEAFMDEHGGNLDAVLLSRPATAKKYLHLVKKYSNALTIFDTVDLHFVREQRRLELEVRQWKNLEFFLANETDVTFVVSPTEKTLLSQEAFADKVAVVSNIHTLEPCTKGFEERDGLMFIGGFAHPPNEEGIVWFIEYILPMIRKQIPAIHLTIVGSDPSERLLAQANQNVTVTGYVEDVAPYFNNSRVFVSPLLHGAGVKGKIGQSFSYGLPVVTTSIGAEGMHLEDGHNALISDSETEFAQKVIDLYTDNFLWQKISANSRQVITDQFSTGTIRVALEQALAVKSHQSMRRPVIVHCHIFKNAGSTLDWSLERQFGAGFTDHRDDDSMRKGAQYLGHYLTGHQELRALSSHHIRFPLPDLEELEILPIIALRHPIDRARSVYEFERRQQASTPGSVQAKALSFTDYIKWRMQADVSPTIRNFQCCVCSNTFDKAIGESEYLEAVARLSRTPLLVLVERYDESMLLLEKALSKYYPDIDLAYVAQNASTDREESLQQRVQSVYDELGEELTRQFRESNHWDMKLYESAQAILGERLGSLGNADKLLHNFRSRCRLLSQ